MDTKAIILPSRKLHNRFAESLGIDKELADIVNKKMDEPSKWLGPSHRIVRHDIPYALKMAFEIPRERTMKLEGVKRRKEVTPADVMKAYGVHLLMDLASENPSVRRMFRVMEALSIE
jgi:hypothetical protein